MSWEGSMFILREPCVKNREPRTENRCVTLLVLGSWFLVLDRQRQPDAAPEQRHHMAELDVEEVMVEQPDCQRRDDSGLEAEQQRAALLVELALEGRAHGAQTARKEGRD